MSPAQDFTDAILITTERETAGGELWCPRKNAEEVRSWVTDRSKSLGGALRQLVRLIRLMSIIDDRHYVNFLYVRIEFLRTRSFKREIEAAVITGKLSKIAHLIDRGVIMIEPCLMIGGKPFEIDFVQMPSLGALLDILHNMLGFKVVEEMIEPVLSASEACDVDEIARQLSSSLNAWIAPKLGSSHQMRQAKAIRSFLVRSTAMRAESITDDIIFDLWICLSIDPDVVEGFRLFRSTARLVIRYKQSLSLADSERAVTGALGFVSADEASSGVNLDTFDASPIQYNEWTSPFLTLFSFPADRVKWLTKTDSEFLIDIFGSVDSESSDKTDPARGGIFGNETFDNSLWKTILRVGLFGPAQNTIVERARKKINHSGLELKETYSSLADRYLKIHNDAHQLLGATAFVLICAKKIEGLALAQAFLGDRFKQFIVKLDPRSGSTRPRPTDLLAIVMSRIEDVKTPEGKSFQNAYKSVNRIGFRKQDLLDEQFIDAMTSGSLVLEKFDSDLRKFVSNIKNRDLENIFEEDKIKFEIQLSLMYKGGTTLE